MNDLAGTGALTRLALRLDRIRLPLWVLVIGVMPAGTASNYKTLYPTAESLKVVEGVIDSPALVAMSGPLFRVSLGGLTVWKVGITSFVLAALMSVFTVIRHTRADEENGRLELVGAAVVGRRAPLTAALITMAMANAGIVVVTALGLIGVGMSAVGSFAFGAAIGLTGLTFGAVAAVCAQLTAAARVATGTAAAALAAVYLLRAAGDTGPTWLSWISPIGWALRIRPYAREQWWVLALFAGLVIGLLAVAYALLARRDVGTGLLAERAAPTSAGPTLGSALGLAWRLQRGVLLGWAVAMAIAGASMGSVVKSLSLNTADLSQQMIELLTRMGGQKALTDQFLAAVCGIAGLVAAAYTVQSTLRLRVEENEGHVEPLLATRVGRLRWAGGHLVFGFVGTGVLLAVFGAALGLVYGAQTHDIGGQLPRLTGAALVQLPAAWVLAGVGIFLFGVSARLAALTWGALIVCVVLVEVGELFGLDQAVVDVTPFAHVPKLPGSALTGPPLVWLTAIAALLAVAGLACFRRRDVG